MNKTAVDKLILFWEAFGFRYSVEYVIKYSFSLRLKFGHGVTVNGLYNAAECIDLDDLWFQ